MKPVGVHHVSICVRDVEEAVGFYTGVLGFEVAPRPDELGPGAWLQVGGQQLHLMKMDETPPRMQHFAVQVDDLDGAVSEITAAGWKVDLGGGIAGVCRQAFLHDPSGNFVELNQPA